MAAKAIITWVCIAIWLLHLVLGIGAGYSALRLWPSRQNPFIRRLMLYVQGFIIEVVTAVALVFVARGVHFTLTFTVVMFGGLLLGDLVRAPLIVYLMKGPNGNGEIPEPSAKPPEWWLEQIRTIVQEEVAKKVVDSGGPVG